MKRRMLTILLAMSLSGCATTGAGGGSAAGATIDGTSEDATRASITAMMDRLDNRNKCLLQAALLRIRIGERDKAAAATGNKDAAPGPIGPKINGMTYPQIVQYSRQYPDKVVGVCRN